MNAALFPQELPYPIASLYVGDLDLEVTEALLYEKFLTAGSVLSIRLCRNMVTKQSLGYAYVNFTKIEDAEKALDTLNFEIIKGNPMRIMWSQRDPSVRKSGVGNIFIKNLDKSIDNKALYDTFSAFGNIHSCKVATDEKGVSNGYGFVHFETEEAAKTAIEKVNGMLLKDKAVYVGHFMSRTEREKQLGVNGRKFTNVYIKNFGDFLDDDQLFEMFSKFGKINSHKIMKTEDGISKGFGFVSFEDPEAAKEAVKELNNTEVAGKFIYVGRAQKKSERQSELKKKFELLKLQRLSQYQSVNLYVKNLEESFDDDDLRKLFSGYGTITSAKIMKEENNKSKCFGFVCFSTPEEAMRAVSGLHNKIIAAKPLYVALAQRKEERKYILASQHRQHMNSLRVAQTNQCFISNEGPHYISSVGTQPRFYNPQFASLRARWPSQPSTHTRFAAQPIGNMNLISHEAPRPPFSHTNISFMQTRTAPIATAGLLNNPTYFVNRPPIYRYSSNVRYPQEVEAITTAPEPSDTKSSECTDQQGSHTTTTTRLADANPQEQKQILGERLYPLIKELYPDWAGKITGMLLEIDNLDLLHLMDSSDSLKAKVEEAVAVLQAHEAKEDVDSKKE